MYRNHVGRWRPVDSEVGPFLADTIFVALHLIRLKGEGVKFAAESLVEEAGFEPSVPRDATNVQRRLCLVRRQPKAGKRTSTKSVGRFPAEPMVRIRFPPAKSLLRTCDAAFR